MELIFRIHYHTLWNETLMLTLADSSKTSVQLYSSDGEFWEVHLSLGNSLCGTLLSYHYSLVSNGQVIRSEAAIAPHFIALNYPKDSQILIEDSWQTLPVDYFLYSSAFYKQVSPLPSLSSFTRETITFRALSPALHTHQLRLGISGNQSILGDWSPTQLLLMQEVAPNEWMITIPLEAVNFPLEYKFVAYSEEDSQLIKWEEGENNSLYCLPTSPGKAYVMNRKVVKLSTAIQKVAGTAIPLFSLRSEGSAGVGDLGDLKKMVDWAVLTGQQAIQILPINDTTITHSWSDSYPYNSISIYAFHPMYVDIRALCPLHDIAAMENFEVERCRLNSLPQVDYEAVNRLKNGYLHALFLQEGENVLTTFSFLDFFESNKEWLMNYGAFCYLRDLYGTANYADWPTSSHYREEVVAELCEPGGPFYEKIAYHFYVQYLLHVQLLEVAHYARQEGIILKGDIPIGISRNSVEAWVEPYYFTMDGQAGAPPDAFSANGQNWGFPTYNWEVMEQDNYQWWRKRFAKMAEYFTAYRIDHILGFFRIWEIPSHSVHGLLGQFTPALPMSIEEINSYGLPFQQDFMTLPFITEELLDRYFGEYTQLVKDHFVAHSHWDVYIMREGFKTQRQVAHHFAGATDSVSMQLRDGLYALISNVLFVPDRKDATRYHPRISAQQDYTYSRLNQAEQDAFDRLYNEYYYKRHNDFWYNEAMKKLPTLIQSTPMLVCGEDLGMVPHCVPWVMEELQILSLEIERMPKDPASQFGEVSNYPYLSVCTISTHDMTTLRGWWEEDSSLISTYYHKLGHYGETPAVASGAICQEIIGRHLASPSLLVILTLQDWLSMDESLRQIDVEEERINVPANPRHYWRYRMHLTLEELLDKRELNDSIRKLITSSGR
ncbi:MAG: 4-alpha-glucanotransferase [Phocaeicola sp.]